MINEIPLFIYKYKSINTAQDLCRLFDLINNNRIYFPIYSQLNDPLEGQVTDIEISGYAGASMSHEADAEDSVIKGIKEDYRILAFSSEADNPLLWTHYANEYKGVCLCFSTNNTFRSVQKVEYYSDREQVFADSLKSISVAVKKSFYKKNNDWQYEREWRLVKKTNTRYVKFEDSELKGIILGHNMPDEIKSLIKDYFGDRIRLMKTNVGYRTNGITLHPIDYVYDWNGSPLKKLDIEKTLSRNRCVYKK